MEYIILLVVGLLFIISPIVFLRLKINIIQKLSILTEDYFARRVNMAMRDLAKELGAQTSENKVTEEIIEYAQNRLWEEGNQYLENVSKRKSVLETSARIISYVSFLTSAELARDNWEE